MTTSLISSSLAELPVWLAGPEGTNFEFKEAKTSYSFDKLVDYCVALANDGGGKIILRVTDKRPRRIVGTRAFAEPGRTEAGLYQKIGKHVRIEELDMPAGRVVVVHVPCRLAGMAWDHNGRYLKRAGDELAPMSSDELRVIFAEVEEDFSADICPALTMRDLMPEAIAAFRERWAQKDANDRVLTWNDEETLISAGLLDDGGVTYAALILFGTPVALRQRLGMAEVIFEYRPTEASGPAADREEYRLGFLAYHDAIWQKINLRNDRQSIQSGFFRYDLFTFDEKPVREAVLNAVMHRDYRNASSVFVRQYPRRLEVVSPGGLPYGITVDNIITQQNPRNRRLAEALNRCGLVERSGQGINLMVERAIRQSKALPDFSGTAAHEVWLTLNGVVQSPDFVRYIERLGEENLRHFSTDDFLALDYVRRELRLPPHLRERMSRLIEVGAVESIGTGRGTRYLLSRGAYTALGAKGVYTRKRGLDHETNKALLMTHLRQQGDDGAPLPELLQVLPALSGRAVQRMLSELREEGLVTLRGERRWAVWVAQPSQDRI